MQQRRKSPNREESEAIAVQALQFLADDEERLNLFLTKTGMTPENLRLAASSEHFLGAVLDYLTSEDVLILAFCESSQLKPEDVTAAAQFLAR